MRFEKSIIAVLVVLFAFGPVLFAVETREIDMVREKGVLDSRDFEVIDRFVSEAIAELVMTKDFTTVARSRAVILSNNSSNKDSAQQQYGERFSKAAYKSISTGFQTAESLETEENKFKAVLNLLILIDGLEDLRFVDLAIERLGDDNEVVSYWAVHCVTNQGIVERINGGGVEELKRGKEIAAELKKRVAAGSVEELALMVRFAGELEAGYGVELLLAIADRRTAEYAEWSVEGPLLDATVLKSLCVKLAGGVEKASVGRGFGQLYSYAIERYIVELGGDGLFDEEQTDRLASALVEVEDKCVGRLLGLKQMVIQRAVGRGDRLALQEEYDRLFGSESAAGVLAVKVGFDYGQADDGAKLLSPRRLPAKK